MVEKGSRSRWQRKSLVVGTAENLYLDLKVDGVGEGEREREIEK